MAHLWLPGGPEDWAVLLLAHDAYSLDANPPAPFAAPGGADGEAPRGEEAQPRAALIRAHLPTGDAWMLLTGSGHVVRVNGLPVAAGARLLNDRDRIAAFELPPMFFSTERLAELKPFAGAAQPMFCPRCRQAIESGTPAVECPGCDVWYHGSDDLPCWTYTESCAICGHRTALEAGFSWMPEAR